MSEYKQLLEQIESQLKTIPDFGQLQVHIKRHRGAFVSPEVVKITPHPYSDSPEPNVDLTTDIFNLIKLIADSGLTCSVGINMDFKNGKAMIMNVQDFKKL